MRLLLRFVYGASRSHTLLLSRARILSRWLSLSSLRLMRLVSCGNLWHNLWHLPILWLCYKWVGVFTRGKLQALKLYRMPFATAVLCLQPANVLTLGKETERVCQKETGERESPTQVETG